jgi:glycosyltransferase involved in cell wall biosynthesis
MKYQKKVSIIIPVYNGSNFLSEAIDSALRQTYQNIEIIVIDDGSNDNGVTKKIARSYGNKIKYVYKKNGGVASALNLGLEIMKGDYFSWLSHDDMYTNNKIEEEMEVLSGYDNEDVAVACNAKVLFKNGVRKKTKIDPSAFKFFDIFLATSSNVGLNGCSLLLPRKILLKHGGFNTSLPVTQDYDLWFRLKDDCSFVLLEKWLVTYRIHSEQDSVIKKGIMLSHGDRLHSNFLKKISEKRYRNYFETDKNNINKFINNYKLYRKRGYTKTSIIMLKIILSYFYSDNSIKFCNLYNSEVGQYFNRTIRRVGREYVSIHENGINEPLTLISLLNSIELLDKMIKADEGRKGSYPRLLFFLSLFNDNPINSVKKMSYKFRQLMFSSHKNKSN